MTKTKLFCTSPVPTLHLGNQSTETLIEVEELARKIKHETFSAEIGSEMMSYADN